jgi:competence protein ComEC
MSHFSDKLHSAPFIRLLVPFIAGIVSGDSCVPELKWIFLGVSLFLALLLPFFVNLSFKRESLFGILLCPVLFFLGLFISLDRKYRPEPLPKSDYYAVIDEFPVEKDKSFRVVIRLIKPKIKVLAYIDKSVIFENVEPGTILWFRGRPEVLLKTGNPFEFDYAAYAIRNGIGHRIYLAANSVHIIKGEKDLTLMEWSLIIRDRLIRILEKSRLKGEVLHLVSAVALGARENLEPETTQSFAKTGVIHVLAVSGMNVGIIYVVLEWLLRFMVRKRGGIILQTLLIICACWGYALITGLSASVLRAAAMFSFIVVGRSLIRHPNIYNTLAASAFVLLCFNPALVYDVGFQLSYAAVFSIVYFHPFLYSLLYFKYRIPDQVWSLLTVSTAAQIGTIPLLLHYFHQFPTWFLLANLMVIPLVTVILYLSFIVFAVAPIIPFLGGLITHILDWAGQGMLFSVHFVERLPYPVLDGLYPSDTTIFLALLFSVMVVLFIVYKSAPALKYAFISIIILLIFNNMNKYKKFAQKEVVVFNIQGKTLVALTSGSETTWLTTEKSCTVEKLKYYTKPYETFRGIKKVSIVCLSDSSRLITSKLSNNGNFMNFEGLKLCVLYERTMGDTDWEHFPSTDMIILSEKSPADPALVQKYLPSAVIIESRMPFKAGEGKNYLQMALNDLKVFNTTMRGAVKTTFRPVTEGKINILSCGYFNR